jgi:CheY-like chemotaxis protein
VLGNDALLTQCFSNLLGNAVKFVPSGVKAKVRVHAERRDGVVKIWVQDQGIGIPKNAQSKLFGMFQKLDSQYEGTGIGLAIVRKVIYRMGGKVGVESEPGAGSSFWVELPVANGGTTENRGQMSKAIPPILAADDEETDRFILKLAVKTANLPHPLVTVCDGKECVDYLSGIAPYADRALYPLPALLLLDLKMPNFDGFEVLAWLAARPEFKDLPVVVLSSSSPDSDIKKARQLGAHDYFVKPHAVSDFVKVLHSLQDRWLAATSGLPAAPVPRTKAIGYLRPCSHLP